MRTLLSILSLSFVISLGLAAQEKPAKRQTPLQKKKDKKKSKQRNLASSYSYPDSCQDEASDPAYDTDVYAECVNNKAFYPIHWGDPSTENEIGCMHVLQSNQDENSFEDDVEDWLLIGGSTDDAQITSNAGERRIFIHMTDYIGGIKWAYVQNEVVAGNTATIPDTINDCALANFGLQIAFVTAAPIHVLVFETLTGNILH